jgi:hypothetical protein
LACASTLLLAALAQVVARCPQLAHAVMLNCVGCHNGYFKLGLDDEIQPRLQGFLKIWKCE